MRYSKYEIAKEVLLRRTIDLNYRQTDREPEELQAYDWTCMNGSPSLVEFIILSKTGFEAASNNLEY